MNNLLRDEIARIVQRDLEDPHIGFVTITGVEVAADLSNATVFASVLGDAESKRDTIRALVRGRGFIRGLLRDRLDLRRIPQLRIELDETAERAQGLERVLHEMADDDSPNPPAPFPEREGGERRQCQPLSDPLDPSQGEQSGTRR